MVIEVLKLEQENLLKSEMDSKKNELMMEKPRKKAPASDSTPANSNSGNSDRPFASSLSLVDIVPDIRIGGENFLRYSSWLRHSQRNGKVNVD